MKNKTRARATWIAGAGVLMGLLTLFLLGLPAEASDGTTVRPISDFLDAQTFPSDIVDWVSDDSQTDPIYRARIDFLGLINEGFVKPRGLDIGTSFSGTVTERVRQDGRTEVHVVLHGEDVLFFVWSPVTGQLLAGRPAGAFVAGRTIATCSLRYDLKYITTNEPGDPMPGLVPLLFNTPEGSEILQSKLTARGGCELRSAFGVEDGSPGRFTLNMNGLIHPKGGDVTTGDTYAVGFIHLRATGN